MSWVSAKLAQRLPGLLAALLLAAACGPGDPGASRPIGEAYVAPETIELRKDIPLDSGVSGAARHGERVEILQRRRRFVRVRTAAKQEGWTEQNKLLTPEVFAQIGASAKEAASLPGHGAYRARDTLNVHIEPYRSSPTIYQLKEDETAELLNRRVVERTRGPAAAGAPPDQPKQYDDWCFVRVRNGRAGWVLARMIDAGIPDEVAQYAEGRRITSYFALGEVADQDSAKKIWLWTTIERGLEPYDFDSFRVFNWSRRRRRYETAYIERKVKGYFPITVAPNVHTQYGAGPGFSLITEKKDGRRYRRRFVLLGHLVRMHAEEPL